MEHPLLSLTESQWKLRPQHNQNFWFKSYISDCNQFASINCYDSGLAAINCGIPQGSALRPILFLLYINDLKPL